MEYDKFYGKITRAGNSLAVFVPSNFIKFGGYSEGDEVEVMVKKKRKK